MTPTPRRLRGSGTPLEQAILTTLDGLLRALELTPQGDDRFRVEGTEPNRFGRLFGGQLIAQAWRAATATVTGKQPNSLHAYFVESGTPGEPVDLIVEHVRDGRSMATRRVTVEQGGRALLVALVSFHDNLAEPELAAPPPVVPQPEDVPLLQDWVDLAPPDLRSVAGNWIKKPPPLEMRIGEAPRFMGGDAATGTRSHWMRLPREIGEDPALHSALLAYASDYLLLDMALRSHPEKIDTASFRGTSLDHGLWLHRPVRFDEWHLHTQQLLAISGHRALVRGEIHDGAGHLVASTTQEVLVRLR